MARLIRNKMVKYEDILGVSDDTDVLWDKASSLAVSALKVDSDVKWLLVKCFQRS